MEACESSELASLDAHCFASLVAHLHAADVAHLQSVSRLLRDSIEGMWQLLTERVSCKGKWWMHVECKCSSKEATLLVLRTHVLPASNHRISLRQPPVLG